MIECSRVWGIWCIAPEGSILESGWYDGAFMRVERVSEAEIRSVMRKARIPDHEPANGWRYEPREIPVPRLTDAR